MNPRLLPVPLLALAAGLAGCTKAPDPWEAVPGGPPRVLASIPPLACFVRNVAGDRAAVHCLCTTQGPHHFEATPRDTAFLHRADLFFANGLELDDFADTLHGQGANPRLRFVHLGNDLPAKLLLAADADDDDHDHAASGGKDHGHAEHHHGAHDPHVWLGIPQAAAMVEGVRKALAEADPVHAADYERNAAAFTRKLDDLHAEGKKLLAAKKDRKLVSFHESLAYFAKSFGLEVAGVIENVPGDTPSSPRLQKLVALCEKEKVRVIAVEPQYPTTTAAGALQAALKAKGLDVRMVEIDPLETADPGALDAGWYVAKMRENLTKLAEALP